MTNKNLKQEFYEVYFDMENVLHDLLFDEVHRYYPKKRLTRKGLEAVKAMRSKMVDFVAGVKNVETREILDELKEVHALRDVR